MTVTSVFFIFPPEIPVASAVRRAVVHITRYFGTKLIISPYARFGRGRLRLR